LKNSKFENIRLILNNTTKIFTRGRQMLTIFKIFTHDRKSDSYAFTFYYFLNKKIKIPSIGYTKQAVTI